MVALVVLGFLLLSLAVKLSVSGVIAFFFIRAVVRG
jgi:hypothetical protein